MKKFAAIIFCILTAANSAAASDPEFYGNVLAAQSATDPRVQAGLLISALENTSCSRSDIHVLNMLDNALAKAAVDQTLLMRLFKLYKKRPEDLDLGLSLSKYAEDKSIFADDYLSNAVTGLKKHDFSRLSPQDKTLFVQLLNRLLYRLIYNGKFTEGLSLLDELQKNAPGSIDLLQAKVLFCRNACFRINHTAPLMKNYDKLPDNDLWKTSLTQAAKQLLPLIPRDEKEADAILWMMLALNMPQSADAIKTYSAQFPDHPWQSRSAQAAVQNQKKDLFIPGESIYLNFLCHLKCRNFRAAKRLIRHLNKKGAFEFELILKSAQGKHKDVIKMLNSGEVPLDKIYPGVFRFAAISLHAEKNLTLLNKLVNQFAAQLKKNEMPDPDVCNSLGYVAADLNTNLHQAEKLIRVAVSVYPGISSYRDSMAWVLYRQGRFAEAEKEIDTAIRYREPSPAAAVMFLHAAEIKLALNKKTEAKTNLEYAKKLYDPEDQACHEYDLRIQKKLEKILL